mmetsp:Transcript_67502/g.200686  ORF Transcript_67502/g.200686 Transcript_67502/m.200686 type:complete len:258 (+) Transcript_67502:131-904(+)
MPALVAIGSHGGRRSTGVRGTRARSPQSLRGRWSGRPGNCPGCRPRPRPASSGRLGSRLSPAPGRSSRRRPRRGSRCRRERRALGRRDDRAGRPRPCSPVLHHVDQRVHLPPLLPASRHQQARHLALREEHLQPADLQGRWPCGAPQGDGGRHEPDLQRADPGYRPVPRHSLPLVGNVRDDAECPGASLSAPLVPRMVGTRDRRCGRRRAPRARSDVERSSPSHARAPRRASLARSPQHGAGRVQGLGPLPVPAREP